jgi:osmotically-inducible protein OsmY
MADRNRYNRGGRYRDWDERDERSWREQEEQFSDSERMQPDYEEGYGAQMSEPYGGYRQRQGEFETASDRNSRYRQGGSGYSRDSDEYRSTGQRRYGPAHFEGSPGWRESSFTMADQAGRDYNSRTDRNYGAYGSYGSYGYPGYGGYSGFGSSGIYGDGGGYRAPQRQRGGGRGRGGRDWWDRASDEVMSWFGDEDAARRRKQDYRGRGPQDYTRSDDRIREDVNDNLTDDWGVDASAIKVSVSNAEVTLDGTVPTRLQKRRAEDCAEDVSGVKHVQNNLRVKESSTWDRSDRTDTATNQAGTGAKTSTTNR